MAGLALPAVILGACLLAPAAAALPAEEFPMQGSPADSALARGINDFGFEVLRRLAEKDSSGNILISPLGLSMAFTAVSDTAEGATNPGLRGITGLEGLDARSLVRYQGEAMAGLADSGSPWGMYCRFAQALWDREEGAPLKDSIDAWVRKNMANRIQSLWSSREAPQAPPLAASAFFLQGFWQEKFGEAENVEFVGADGRPLPRPAMSLKAVLPTSRADSVRTLEILFWKGRYGMVILLPDPGFPIRRVVSSMTADIWDAWLGAQRVYPRDATLPHFDLEDRQSFDSATGQAPAGGAGRIARPIRHAARIRLDATRNKEFSRMQKIRGRRLIHYELRQSDPDAQFRVDRPFVFAIRDRRTGVLVLLGRVTDPAPEDQ
jgi:serpin B